MAQQSVIQQQQQGRGKKIKAGLKKQN